MEKVAGIGGFFLGTLKPVPASGIAVSSPPGRPGFTMKPACPPRNRVAEDKQ